MPPRPELAHGILATWGGVVLEPLDNESLKNLAEGKRSTKKGYLIDFIGNFSRSAQEGLPVYRLSGGAGFVWVASYDQKGRGILRFAAIDASVMSPQLVATQPAPNSGDQSVQAPPQNLQFLMNGLRTADEFIKSAEKLFLSTFNDLNDEKFDEDNFSNAREKSSSGLKKTDWRLHSRIFGSAFSFQIRVVIGNMVCCRELCRPLARLSAR